MIFSTMNQLQQRIAVSTIFIVFIILALSLSHIPFFSPLFALIISSAISLIVWEYYRLAHMKGYHPLTSLGVVGTVIYGFSIFLSSQQTDITTTLPEMTLLAILFFAFVYYIYKGEQPFLNLSITLFAMAYLTVPLSCAIYIVYFFPDHAMQDGRWWLLYLLIVTKMTDTGAYFIGKSFGKTKLVPYISPGKTWEGAIGGFTCSILTSFVFFLLIKLFSISMQLSFWECLWIGASLSILAQIGDLAESLLKRDTGVKDSSRIPGLGGMLDIADSLVFTTPFVYLFLKIQFA